MCCEVTNIGRRESFEETKRLVFTIMKVDEYWQTRELRRSKTTGFDEVMTIFDEEGAIIWDIFIRLNHLAA